MASENIFLKSVENGNATLDVQTSMVDDKEFAHSATVEQKYLGTLADQREMGVLGRTQVLRVRDPESITV
jgi:hypothetical protein